MILESIIIVLSNSLKFDTPDVKSDLTYISTFFCFCFQVSIASNNYLEAFEFLTKAKEFNPSTTPVNPIVINNMTLGM